MAERMTTPKPAATPYPILNCRRPYCANPFFGPDAATKRDKHEADATRHTRPEQTENPDFRCEDIGHADMINEVGWCSVCQ